MNKESLCLNGENLLTRNDVLKMFGVSGVTLWKWVKKGIVRQHHIGKLTYYLESELYEDIKRSGASIRRSHKAKVAN